MGAMALNKSNFFTHIDTYCMSEMCTKILLLDFSLKYPVSNIALQKDVQNIFKKESAADITSHLQRKSYSV